MKLRFGEESMHSCEVMLRDIKDSERINREVQKSKQAWMLRANRNLMPNDLDNLYVKVLSTGFWTQFEHLEDDYSDEKVKLCDGFHPGQKFKDTLSDFIDHYKKYKSLRTLLFNQKVGKVDLSLEF